MSFVGIDVGGTNLRVALVNQQGKVHERRIAKTRPERGADATIKTLIGMIASAAATQSDPLKGIGIGITGPVDPVSGVVSNPFTLGGWPPTDMRAPFAEVFGVPIVIDNDANAALMGEWWLGAGQGSRRLTGVTVGTGIGVATIIDGCVQRASDGRHGEAGHMVLDPSGPPCYCGAEGCWEVLASGTALTGFARKLGVGQESALWDLSGGNPDGIDSALLFTAAAKGDPDCAALISLQARWMGLGLVNLAAALTPDVFVLSGGVMEHLDVLRPGIQTVMRRQKAMIPSDIPIRAAALGDDAGPIGAAKMAINCSA